MSVGSSIVDATELVKEWYDEKMEKLCEEVRERERESERDRVCFA